MFYYEENKSAINKILLFLLKTNKKKEMARVNINILGISELKWTGIGEFNSDDNYIDYCGQEYFGHLMQRTDSLEKTLMLGQIQGGKRRGQRMRWSPTQWS